MANQDAAKAEELRVILDRTTDDSVRDPLAAGDVRHLATCPTSVEDDRC
jgi:hypothetical protein